MAGKEMTSEQIAMVMSAVNMIIAEWPLFNEKITQTRDLIEKETKNREKEDNQIRENYKDRFDDIKIEIRRLSGRIWWFIITLIGLFITAGAGVIIMNLSP